jgi:hypothetical protein
MKLVSSISPATVNPADDIQTQIAALDELIANPPDPCV